MCKPGKRDNGRLSLLVSGLNSPSFSPPVFVVSDFCAVLICISSELARGTEKMSAAFTEVTAANLIHCLSLAEVS